MNALDSKYCKQGKHRQSQNPNTYPTKNKQIELQTTAVKEEKGMEEKKAHENDNENENDKGNFRFRYF